MSEDARRRVERNPLRLLDSKDPADAPYVESAPTFESYLCDGVPRALRRGASPFWT